MLRSKNPHKKPKPKENENIERLKGVMKEIHEYLNEISENNFFDTYSSVLREQDLN